MSDDFHVFSTSDCWAAIHGITKPMWEQAMRHQLFPVLLRTNPFSGEGKAPIHGDNAYTNSKGERIPSRQEFYDSAPLVNGGWKGRYKNNVAIECGLRSNVVVIDIDVKPGNNGLADWLAKIKANTPFASIRAFNEAHNGPIVETPSGGFHYYFKYDQEVGLTHKYKTPNSDIYDVQADGKLVVFPGSVYMGCMTENWKTLKWSKPKHKCLASLPQGVEGCLFRGRKYKWVEDHSIDEKSIAEMPSWMKNIFIKEKPRAARMQEPTVLETGHPVFDKIIPLLAPLAGGGKYSAWTRTLWVLTSLGASQSQCHGFSKLGGAAYDYDATQRILDQGSTIQHHVNSLVNLVREAQTQISDQEEGQQADVESIVTEAKKQLDLASSRAIMPSGADEKEQVENKSWATVKAKFEEEVCFIKDRGCYVYKDSRGNWSFRERNWVKTTFEHLKYDAEVYNKKTKKYVYDERSFCDDWFKSEDKLTFVNAGTYPPEARVPRGYKNLWAGMAAEKFEQNESGQEGLEVILEHVMWCCNGNISHYNYSMSWFAQIFQAPAVKPNVMLCWQSFSQGTGKSFIGNIIRKMVGEMHSVGTNQKSITQQFNGIIRNKIFVQIDEMYEPILQPENKQRLLDLITSRTDCIELKGQEMIQQESFTHYFATSNEANGFTVVEGDRRRWVMQTPSENRAPRIYKRLLEIEDGDEAALRAFYDFLMAWRHPDFPEVAMADFDFKTNRPYSDFQEESRLYSRDRELEFVIEFVSDRLGHPDPVITKTLNSGNYSLYSEWKAWIDERNAEYKTNDKAFAMKLAKIIGLMRDNEAIVKSKAGCGDYRGKMVYHINCKRAYADFVARGLIKP